MSQSPQLEGDCSALVSRRRQSTVAIRYCGLTGIDRIPRPMIRHLFERYTYDRDWCCIGRSQKQKMTRFQLTAICRLLMISDTFNLSHARQVAERLVLLEWREDCRGALVWTDAVLYPHPLLTHSVNCRQSVSFNGAIDVQIFELGRLINDLAMALTNDDDVFELCASIGQHGWGDCFRIVSSRESLLQAFIDMFRRGANVYDMHRRNGWLLVQMWTDRSHEMPGWGNQTNLNGDIGQVQ